MNKNDSNMFLVINDMANDVRAIGDALGMLISLIERTINLLEKQSEQIRELKR